MFAAKRIGSQDLMNGRGSREGSRMLRNHVRTPANRRPLQVEALEIRELLSNDALGSSARPEPVVAAAVSDTPVMWGVDSSDGELFSITSPEFDGGSATAGFASYGRLKIDPASNGRLRNIGADIESMVLDTDGVAYFGSRVSPKLSGRTRGAAPGLFKFDVDHATTAGPNVLQFVGSILTPKGAATDHLTGLAFHPQTGQLYALVGVGSSKQTDQLLIVSPSDAAVVSNLGRITGSGQACDKCEDIAFDPSGRLFVTDDRDDHLYELNPATGKIVAQVDSNERGGLTGLRRSLGVVSLAWNDAAGELIGFDDARGKFVALTLGNGNNRTLGNLRGLTDVRALARVATVIDTEPPVLHAALVNDTGAGGVSSSDRITADPTVNGSVLDDSQLRTVTLTLPDLPAGPFDITNVAAADGHFTLARATVEHLIGAPLADGSYTYRLQAVDQFGNTSAFVDVPFTLDATAPQIAGFGLSPGSDTGPAGDGTTRDAVVTLTGRTEVNERLVLAETDATALATGTGLFQFPNLPLQLGDNTFTVRVTDVAGNTRQTTQVITRLAATGDRDAVWLWNDVALEAIRLDASTPLYASRTLAMQSVAVYDTASAIEGTPAFLVARTAEPGTDLDAAIASAAHRVLSYLYPGQQSFLDGRFQIALDAIPDGIGKERGVTLGRSIADDVILIRASDGWDDFVDYVPSSGPGAWQPTAPMFDPALLPNWADLVPFAMTSPGQFAPDGPPPLDSQEYTEAFQEVKLLGRATGSTRTAEQTEIARFWADGPGTFTPPGHWNLIAGRIAQQRGNSVSANARLFAQLNVTMADAAIVAWNAKYAHNSWRPITAIQQANSDGNAATDADTAWTPLLITPPFPEYISGHSTFSSAAAEILGAVLGDDIGFTVGSSSLPGVERRFDNFDAAAAEAGRSRIYGGIHFQFSNADAQTAGRALAQHVLDRFAVATDVQPPAIIIESPLAGTLTRRASEGSGGLVLNDNFTVTGRVLDNLSGVAMLQAQLDSGPLMSLAFDAQGTFTIPVNVLLDGSAQGAHTLQFSAADRFGNAATPLNVPFTLDALAPVITLTSPTDGQAIDVGTLVSGRADATGSSIVKLTYAFDGGPALPIPLDLLTGDFGTVMDLSKLTIGGHALTVSATDAAGNTANVTASVNLPALIPFTIQSVTPAPGSVDVGSTFRPQVSFSRPVDPTTLTSTNFYASDTTGATIPATIAPAMDGMFAWLFFQQALPGASAITVHVEGNTILAAADGRSLDPENDGAPGGTFTFRFSTLSLVPLPGTTLSGKVVDAGNDLKPMTFDDVRAGPDRILHTNDDVFLLPIAGATVFILGLEDQAVVTDSSGNFHFDAVPGGNLKLAVDGRTATNAPAGFFFPEMVMDQHIVVGEANTVMGTMGTVDEMAANRERQEVYLPRLRTAILRTVSESDVTLIPLDTASAPNLSPEQTSQYSIAVAPNSLIGMDGQTMPGGQVGFSTVSPDLVRDMMPQGVMQLATTLTIQAPGVAAFSTPLELTFANVYGAAPASQLDVYSFNHTTGLLEITGTATVSPDGLSATTDPGSGITTPGWFGVTPPGGCGGSGGPPPEPVPAENFFEGEDVVTIHAPVAMGFILDSGGSEIASFTFTADDPNPDLPVPAPIPGCAVPPHKNGDPQQPFLNVTIEIDGPLAKFAKPSKETDLPLVGQAFTLSAGDKQTKTFSITSKLFDPEGLASLDHDQLYGSSIKITEIHQFADGKRTRDVRTFFLYRWVDLTRTVFGEPQPGEGRAFFQRTLVGLEMPVDRIKNVELYLPSAIPTTFEALSIPDEVFTVPSFAIGEEVSQWHFKPVVAGHNNRIFAIKAGVPNPVTPPVQVGTLDLRGTGILPTTIAPNRAGFESTLTDLIMRLNQVPGPGGPGTADDKIDYILVNSNPTRKTVTVSQRFKADFEGFMPLDRQDPGANAMLGDGDDRFTAAQLASLQLRVRAEGSKYFNAFKQKFANIPTGVAGLTVYNVTEGFSHPDVSMEWGPDNGPQSEIGDLGLSFLDVETDPGQFMSDFDNPGIPEAVKELRLTQFINQEVSGGVIVGHLGYLLVSTNVSVGEFAANLAAHEVAHTFGVPNAYEILPDAPFIKATEPVNDVMNALFAGDHFRFFTPDTIALLQAAMGVQPNGDTPLKEALEVFKTNFRFDSNQKILAHEVFGEGVERPRELGVLAGGAALIPGHTIDVGTAVVDQTVSSTLTLINPTNQPLTIDSVSLVRGNAGYSTGGLAPNTVIPGQGSVELTVDFAPATVGNSDDVLVITSDATTSPTFTIPLQGKAISATAAARLVVQANNLGSVRPGQSRDKNNVVTITNDGSQPLTISAIAVAEGAGDFTPTGVPMDVATTPIVLNFGESFSFGVTFVPSRLGLVRGEISIATNDPDQPVRQAGVVGTGDSDLPTAAWGKDFVAIELPGRPGAPPLRTVSDDAGNFSFFLPSSQPYHVVIFDPDTGLVAHGYGTTAPSGRATDLTADLVFLASTAPDSDGDGLPDDIEFAVGTAQGKTDTDGDGLDDFTEVHLGLDPLGGRSVPTGVIASLPLQGRALEVVAQGSVTGPSGQTLYIASGFGGLAVVDASKVNQPILLRQLPLNGNSGDVAIDALHNLAVVSAGAVGLHLVDVSTPAQARLQTTVAVPGGANRVEVYDGLAYVASGSSVVSIDLATGQIAQTLDLGGGRISDLAREGTMLYSMDTNRILRAIDISGAAMATQGSLALALGGGKLFVGNGIAYVPVFFFAGGGFSTVDVTDPNDLTLIAEPGPSAILKPPTVIVANGSGLGVLAGAIDVGSLKAVDIVSLVDPANNYNLVTRFLVPDAPSGLVIAGGIAYIAANTAGVQVVNYVPFDNLGLPPTVSLSAPAADIDVLTPGMQVVEGTTVRLTTNVADDVQVRNVELLVNGRVVQNSVSFPFDFSAIAPTIAASGDTFTIRVRATDTGGNVGLSNLLTFGLVSDAAPPTISSFDPADGSSHPDGVQAVRVTFSKPLASGTVTPANFQLQKLQQLQDAGGNTLTPIHLDLRSDDRLVQLTFAPLPPGSYRLVINGPAVTDRVGHALGTGNVVTSFTLTPRALLTATVADADASTPGLQVYEGTTIHGTVSVVPGVSVQRVDLLLDGQVAATSTTAPFDFSVVAPNITIQAGSFILQARVTSAAGDSIQSNPIQVGLLDDVTVPTVLSFVPSTNSSQVELVQVVEVHFSEPMALDTVTADTVRVQDDSGNPVLPTGFQLGDDDRLVQLSFEPLPAGSYQIVVDGAVSDRAGNALGAADLVSPFTLTPQAALSTSAADADPATPGLQVFEGTTLPLHVTVSTGDVDALVELLVNGDLAGTLTQEPYDFTVIAPNRTLSSDSLTVQARVTPPAGIATLTNLLLIGLLDDVTPPAVVSTQPADGGTAVRGLATIRLHFSEALAVASVTAGNFQLIEAGLGGVFGDGNDVAVPILNVQLQNDDSQIVLATDHLQLGSYQLSALPAGITDRAGNSLGMGTFLLSFTVAREQGVVLLAAQETRSVIVFDSATGTERGTVQLPGPFDFPVMVGDVAVTADGSLGFVTDWNSRVWVIDLSTPVPQLASGINPIPMANPGRDLVLTRDERFLVVTGFRDTTEHPPVSVIDIVTRSEVSTFDLGERFSGSVDVGGDGTVLISTFGFVDFDAFDPLVRRLTIDATGQLHDTGDRLVLANLAPTGNVYIAPGNRAGIYLDAGGAGILSFTLPDLRLVDERPVSTDLPVCAVFSPTGALVYIRKLNADIDVYGFDVNTGTLSAVPNFTIATPGTAVSLVIEQLAISADGRLLYVKHDQGLTIHDAITGEVLATVTDPQIISATGIAVSGGQP
jgi:hypothetical protein